MGEPDGPEERARPHWSVPPPPPLSAEQQDGPTDPGPLGEEFLFHLYRGSELLKEDQVYEAKSELERAIALQPRDVEGQSLLGIVYFRLGHYPRAIQIYEELVRARPNEIAPRVNLALCHLKTSQLGAARLLLEEIVQHRPDHVRAWGYLGLAHQRLGDLDKASVAFERAGKPQLAARVRAARDSELPLPLDAAASSVQEITQKHAQIALSAPPVPRELRGSVLPAAPPAVTPRGQPETLSAAARAATLPLASNARVAVHEGGAVLVRIEGSFHVRSDCLRAVVSDGPGALRSTALRRRSRGLASEEPLGGLTTPFATLEGGGNLVLGAPGLLAPFVTRLEGESLYVREDRLLGFDGSVVHETGRLALSDADETVLVQLSGEGFCVLAIRGSFHGVEVGGERSVQVRGDRLVAWVGRLLARPLSREEAPAGTRGFLLVSGTGTALTDGG